MNFSFVKASANDQTIEETQLVLVYELSRIFECLYETRDLTGLAAFAKTELADYISMCRMLCEQVPWSFDRMTEHLEEPIFKMSKEVILAKMQILMGKTIRGLHYYKRFHEYRGDSPELCMTTLVTQIHYLCRCMGWRFFELVDLGEQRYKERMDDLKKNGVKECLRKEYQDEVRRTSR